MSYREEKCIHFIDIDSVSSLYDLIVRTVENNRHSRSRSRVMRKRLLKKMCLWIKLNSNINLCFLLLEALSKLTYQLFHAGLTCQWRINDIKASSEKIGPWSKMAVKVAAMTNDVIGLQVRLSLLSSASNRISLIIIFSLDASSKLLGPEAWR